MRLLTVCLIATAFALNGVTAVRAQTLDMPANAAGEFELELPHKGMTMDQVERRFGTPTSKKAPVGEPPITRWVYPDYTVYFEYQYVIHAVIHRD